jgi:hypothetical protein
MGRLRARLGRYRRQLLGQPLPNRPAARPQATPAPDLSPLERKRLELGRARSMAPSALAYLLDEVLAAADEVLTVREAAARGGALGPRTIALRHDIDHDVENALRLAELEHAAGVHATYYVLPSAWYYRFETDSGISPLTLKALARMAEMGHEIGLHNDVIGEVLERGEGDPVELLHEELAELRDAGFDVVGSASHGGMAVRKAGVTNYLVFTERGGTEPRTIEPITFTPAPMASFGLEYEAYAVPHPLYLSDSRGRWSVPPQWIRSEVAEARGPLQILTHPEHWALSGERTPVKRMPLKRTLERPKDMTGPTLIRSADERRPMKIIGRADCCARRALAMNKDMFGGEIVYIKDEKSRSDFFVDHAMVGSPTRAQMMRWIAVENIRPHVHRYYQFCQTDRATLDVRDADLLMLDSYSDMNFQAWQHNEHSWRLWTPAPAIRDRAAFEQAFTSVGYLSLDDSVEYHVALIDHYRKMNGHIPVLFLEQPIAYYDKLAHRAEFKELGARLEQIVPDLYFGTTEDEHLEPDDMDSSGPGQTLHFTAATYRRMIDLAMEKGLSEWLPRTTAASRG